ncbi:PIG-L deacetylase family protein [Haloferax sp. YSSS75]|uniref:PIG-L deacetylase family protein n=1 Tax=Haloferax sp. YSSS75 TaxID=3388564 RepID=UPI00398D1FA6
MKVLVLSPHTDDSELGAGGTVSRLKREGHEIFYVAFSSCDESLPSSKQGMLKKEFEQVMELVDPTEYYLLDYTVRRFNERRQDVLDDLIMIRNEIQPDIVIGPSLDDFHQDHIVVANEMIRAFKTVSSIITYELPWNHVNFETEMFYKLTESDISRKIEQLSMYESQIEEKNRLYFRDEYISGLASVRGVQCNSHYAEAFSVVRWSQ